jgi:hypothetical protein
MYFSVIVPAIVGLNASSDEWWQKGLNLGLKNRISLKVCGEGYSNIIFVYYQKSIVSLAPNYASFYVLPGFEDTVNLSESSNSTEMLSFYAQTTFKVKSYSSPEPDAQGRTVVYGRDVLVVKIY